MEITNRITTIYCFVSIEKLTCYNIHFIRNYILLNETNYRRDAIKGSPRNTFNITHQTIGTSGGVSNYASATIGKARALWQKACHIKQLASMAALSKSSP